MNMNVVDPIMYRKYAKIFFHQIVEFPALSSLESFPTLNLTLIAEHFLKFRLVLN